MITQVVQLGSYLIRLTSWLRIRIPLKLKVKALHNNSKSAARLNFILGMKIHLEELKISFVGVQVYFRSWWGPGGWTHI